MTASRNAQDALVAYSTNVHRGETLEDVYRFLKQYTIPVRRRLIRKEGLAGLELRLGIGSARELQRPPALEAFRSFLEEHRLVPFSVNAYPLLDFHARKVKEKVYSPSWTERRRARWTAVIGGILASLVPAGIEASVSTLGGTFRPRGHGPRVFRSLAARYLEALDAFARIEEEQGKTIMLAVEPEPDTTFEVARDVIDFFESYLLPEARRVWGARGLSPTLVESRLRRLFTVNFDTCHFSVLFQDPVSSLRELDAAGLRIGKIHVTNALQARQPYEDPVAYQELRKMHEPRYFHQFCGVDSQGRTTWRGLDLDRLPRRLAPGKTPAVRELRSHYHVPIYLRRWGRLHTTQEDTRRAVLEALRTGLTRQYVIETYTWPILEREEKLVAGICREFRWLQRVLGGRDLGLPGLPGPRARSAQGRRPRPGGARVRGVRPKG